ncbi:putative receptor-like protein kinase At3g47110 [Spinacia oleracea]|uniref:Receptor-like protein kinase At3g47110 n=1 Tax=Spinacia oleracea TaxID=3562 RepID=A0ABM3QWY2_SPIOL|nr:putative receptor-like protein kinase At3g47110 [Spinacia oleracea]
MGPLFKVVANLTSLEFLVGFYNAFKETIPDNISRMRSLAVVTIAENKLSGILPRSIFNISSLQLLQLTDNQLQGTIPENVGFTLPQLYCLDLGGNSFSGPFPISMLNLTSLEYINLSKNNFRGSIPFHLGHLKYLNLLDISYNNLIGDINFISTLVNCSILETLDVRGNHFTGIVPKVMANFSTTLTGLAIGNNPTTGVIPPGISHLINLKYLDMGFCGLTGTIPRDFGRLQKLENLVIQSNKLTGEIPNSFGNLTRLGRLYSDNNQLQGNIPPSLGNCVNLLVMDLSQNKLNGSLPSDLFVNTNFIQLDLSYNSFEGSLPLEISKQINLVLFGIFKNNLSGEIPDVFSNLASLEYLYMGHNFFHGPIPPSVASLKSLLIVDVSHNNLSGPVLEYLSTFPLTYLDLSHNNFEGRVPTKGIFANASAIFLADNSRLCGGIPELNLPKCVEKARRNKSMSRSFKAKIIIPIICSFIGVFSMVTCIWLYLKSRIKKRKSTSSAALVKEPFLKVSYGMLFKATDGFSPANVLGSGTFGSVFKGMLDERTVAVKVLNLQQRGGSKSFMAECEALRYIRHRNLVGILTVCSSQDYQRNDFKALVYEFMPNGSLDKWLYERGNPSLLQRVSIAIDVAQALNYLQCECETSIVHCDLKPSNILLDNDMVAYVADFGLAKVLGQPLHPKQSSSSLSGVRGTLGYVAPEYGLGGEASPEADLYSYGILLLELMTRKRPTDNMFKEDFNLHMYAKVALPDQVLQIVDSTLMEDVSDDVAGETEPRIQAMLQKKEECMMLVVNIGVACSSHMPHDRMKITEALSELLNARNMLCNPRLRRNLPRGK